MAGCGNDDTATPSTSEPATAEQGTEAPTATAAPSPEESSSETVWGEADAPEAPSFTAAPPPTWDAAAEQDALAVAEQTLAAQLDTDRHEDQWWADWSQHLSPTALDLYQLVPPEAIAPATITGPPELDDASEPAIALVDIPTDLGTYRLALTRHESGDPWLVETITPPEGLH